MNDFMDIASIIQKVDVIKCVDNVTEINEFAKSLVDENIRIANEIMTFVNIAYNIKKDLVIETKEILAISKINEIQKALHEFDIDIISDITIKYNLKEFHSIQLCKEKARKFLKKSLCNVSQNHLTNMLINSVYTNKMIILKIIDSTLPVDVMNKILEYTSLSFVWVLWIKGQDKETLNNTRKIFKRYEIDNILKSPLRPWDVDFLNNVDSHSWSNITNEPF